MGRFTRVIAVEGTGGASSWIAMPNRAVYLNLLRENIDLYGVALIGYCLMSNHVHLIAVPRKADGLAQALKQTQGALCFLLERRSPIERACVARSILFLPAGRAGSLGSIALHRAQSDEGKKDEARTAYQAAIVAAGKLDPQRQADYIKYIEASIQKLLGNSS
jgi:hypothetical protein